MMRLPSSARHATIIPGLRAPRPWELLVFGNRQRRSGHLWSVVRGPDGPRRPVRCDGGLGVPDKDDFCRKSWWFRSTSLARRPRRLEGGVVVITGASAGIGRALAVHLSTRGARLVLAAPRVERLQELNDSLGGGHVCVQTDVAAEADCERLVARAIAAFGRIDTLICNAGYGLIRPVARLTRDEGRSLFDTNVLGTTDCIRHALPHILNQEPRDGGAGRW